MLVTSRCDQNHRQVVWGQAWVTEGICQPVIRSLPFGLTATAPYNPDHTTPVRLSSPERESDREFQARRTYCRPEARFTQLWLVLIWNAPWTPLTGRQCHVREN